ncbi:hypothetical protein [Paracoccus mutanolyticus]|uniref:hypothetical protein n=1 Tax=Paracoccus mutanolyticus TaxID=1499308 RepID=UPI001CB92620|nr:hypothetical protein [Paracoccus mutanolyticus]
MTAEPSTAPAATSIVFCAATTMRASSGRPSASAPMNQTQPRDRSKGGALRPRRFCRVARSPIKAGPNRAIITTTSRKITAHSANLSAHSIRA